MIRRRLNRRSFLARVVGVGAFALVGGAALAGQVSDRDPSDPVGRGRGGGTGVTDTDSGAGADPAGRGRGGSAPQSQSDSDRGPQADRPGCGRGVTGITDRDSGANADPARRGRGSADDRYSAIMRCQRGFAQ